MKTTSSAVVKRRDLPGQRCGGSAWCYHQNNFGPQEVSRRVALKRRRWPDPLDGYARLIPPFTHPNTLAAGQERLAFRRTRRHCPCASCT